MEPRVQHYIRQCSEDAAEAARDNVWSDFILTEYVCESEIERLFLIGLIRWKAINFLETFEIRLSEQNCSFDATRDYAWSFAGPGRSATVAFPQCPIGRFRVDFLLGHLRHINADDGTEHWIAVECDGHDFHEKTKEQAQRDKARDRALMAHGVKVMRFTGSEIWRDPSACVIEAIKVLDPDALALWVQGVNK